MQKPYDMERLLLGIRRALERKWAEEALRASAETYSDICERSLTYCDCERLQGKIARHQSDPKNEELIAANLIT